MQEGQIRIEKRLDNMEQGQAHTNTVIEALAAGQNDLREKMVGLEAGVKIEENDLLHDVKSNV